MVITASLLVVRCSTVNPVLCTVQASKALTHNNAQVDQALLNRLVVKDRHLLRKLLFFRLQKCDTKI